MHINIDYVLTGSGIYLCRMCPFHVAVHRPSRSIHCRYTAYSLNTIWAKRWCGWAPPISRSGFTTILTASSARSRPKQHRARNPEIICSYMINS